MFSVQSTRPDPRLTAFVRSYVQREAHPEGTEMVEPVVARLGTMLEFQFASPYEVPIYGTDCFDPCPRTVIVGPITYRRVRLVIRGHVQALAVLFEPLGFYGLFGVPVAPLAEGGTDAPAVLGPAISAFRERLGNAGAFSERVHLLNEFLLDRLGRSRSVDHVAGAFRALIASGPLVRVGEVARQTGLCSRQLERKSLEYTGVTPKMLTRVARFQRALHMKTQANLSWTEVAHSLEYHDQMHMIRDFHAFAGDSPERAVEHIAPDHLIRLIADSGPLPSHHGSLR